MKRYVIKVYGNKKEGKFSRLFFLVEDNGLENFQKAETTKKDGAAQFGMGYDEAVKFIKDNKLRLIDEFKVRLY